MPSNDVGAPRPLASQQPLPTDGKHRPPPLPSLTQSRSAGHAPSVPIAHAIVHLLSVPSAPHVPESQSVFAVQSAPTPVVEYGVTMHVCAKQTWFATVQSASVSQTRSGTCAVMNAFSASTRVSAPNVAQV